MVLNNSLICAVQNMTNGVELNYNYDANYRLSCMSYSNDEGTLKSYRFAYDMDDNIIEKNDDYYSYDRLGRLQSAMIVGSAGSQEYEPPTSLQQYGLADNDVLGDQTFSVETGDLTISTNAESFAIDIGYAYTLKRVEIPVNAIDLDKISKDTLQVHSSLYNTDVSFNQIISADITVSDSLVTITFAEPTYARYVKLHSTIHELDQNGEPTEISNIMDIDSDGIVITAITGGSNEFYNYTPDGNRSQKSVLSTEMVSETYTYYANSDLVKIVGDTAYKGSVRFCL